MLLRPYQQTAIEAVQSCLGDRPILVAPTGSGKTVMAAEIVRRLAVPTLWLAHRTELIEQAARQLSALGLDVGIIKAGFPPRQAPIQVASIQTLIRREVPACGLVVIDECHHATAATYRRVLDRVGGANIIGMTATPFRLDGRGLGDIFREIVVAATVKKLCADGYLHEPRVWCGSAPDLRGVRVQAGDYQTGELASRAGKRELIADIVAGWKRLGRGRTVVFAVNVEHSQTITRAFLDAGIHAQHLDGTTPADQRAAILARLRAGEIQVVSNCMVLAEGWDLPALETAIMARPTASLNLHLQTIGRIMRATDGKAGAVVLDHANNTIVHGRVTREIAYSLDPGSKAGESEPLGMRICRACQFLFDLSDDMCPECGWTPEKKDQRVTVRRGELIEISDAEERRRFWIAIAAQGAASGYKPGWAAFRFRERFNSWPLLAGGELVDPTDASQEEKRAVYADLLATARRNGFADGWASHKYRDAFGVWPTGFVGEIKGTETAETLQRRWNK